MIKAMSQTGLNLFIPMELLINSLNALSLSEKQQLWRILDEAIADAEEDDWREDEETKKEIQLVRDEYANGNYTKFSNIKEQLKQGAIQRAERDLELVDEWFNLEEEAC
jgi:H2-forming N5,N10-methylenetetrahydromethanopterin dehydrogenase-like enzyme